MVRYLSGKQSLQRAGAKIPSDAKPTSFRGNVTVVAARAGLHRSCSASIRSLFLKGDGDRSFCFFDRDV